MRDAFADREAKNYANPIASREMILELLEKSTGPLTRTALAEKLEIQDEEPREALRRRLIAMVRDGQIVCNRKGAYGPLDKTDLVRGRVQGHKDGFGFVLPLDKGSEDVYLGPRQMRKVFTGDDVLVRINDRDSRGRLDGSIVEVIARNTVQLVGRFYHEKGINFVRPDNPRIGHDIMIPQGDTSRATSGQFVTVGIIQQPDRRQLPTGKVLEILGDHLAPGMEIDVAIRSHDIPHEWPREVQEQTAGIPAELAETDKKTRIDLRKLPFVTIDGEDARDFDDAVYCEKRRLGGWRLYVAIADVSHYVMPRSALDQEALVRGNSVYFPDHVVPMLPEVLSNGLCSLNPHVDRLCMVCEMTISAAGKISGYVFYESVMHSHARLTYTEVGQIVKDKQRKNSGVRKQHHKVVPFLDELHKLYSVLRQERDRRGAIDFDSSETRMLFDEDRKIKKIIPVERNDAHKMIEECMLAANVCAAKFLEAHELTGLYRVHEGPTEEKLKKLKAYLKELNLGIRGKHKVEPADFQEVLALVADRPDAHIIQTVMLRSMNQAVYLAENSGHFGLAYKAYAHFTSPIRRYPDLLVHRAIRSVLYSKTATKKVKRTRKTPKSTGGHYYPYDAAMISGFGEQCSLTERRADDATRDVVSWLKCEYLQDKIGEEFEGVIAGVTGFGIFVELKDLYVEGLVHITALPEDYYRFEAAHHRLIGERKGKVYQLGDALRVKVVSVKLEERKIDFELSDTRGRRRKVKVSAKAKKLAEEYKEKNSRKGKNSSAKNKPEKNKPAKNKATKKGPAKKGSAKKGSAKKGSAKKGSEQKSPAKKSPGKKDPVKRDSAKKGPAKKTAVKKSPTKKKKNTKSKEAQGGDTRNNRKKSPKQDSGENDKKNPGKRPRKKRAKKATNTIKK